MVIPLWDYFLDQSIRNLNCFPALYGRKPPINQVRDKHILELQPLCAVARHDAHHFRASLNIRRQGAGISGVALLFDDVHHVFHAHVAERRLNFLKVVPEVAEVAVLANGVRVRHCIEVIKVSLVLHPVKQN